MNNQFHYSFSNSKDLHYILRFASAMCFIGHGAFGIITKQIWCNYFALFGISSAQAYHLMPVIGTIDILLGLSLLFYPTRAVLTWLVLWGGFTAILRPLSGEYFAEMLERAGNYGVPLALLILSGHSIKNRKEYFTAIDPNKFIDEEILTLVNTCLRVVVFFLLTGHGWLNLVEKNGLLNQYRSIGLSHPVSAAHIIGIFEIIGALSILIHPFRTVLLILITWKISSELFYSNHEMLEWIERGGSYGAILALLFLYPISRPDTLKFTWLKIRK